MLVEGKENRAGGLEEQVVHVELMAVETDSVSLDREWRKRRSKDSLGSPQAECLHYHPQSRNAEGTLCLQEPVKENERS